MVESRHGNRPKKSTLNSTQQNDSGIGSGLFPPSTSGSSAASIFNDDIPLIPQYFLNVIVFSKDKPQQLGLMLESFFQHVQTTAAGLDQINLTVLYAYSNPERFKPPYDKLIARFRQVRFLKDERTPDQIVSVLKEVPEEREGHELLPFLMFLTDEMVIFRDICLKECLETLQAQTKAYGIHLKLNPAICYSQTNQRLMHCPQNFEPILKQGQSMASLRFLKYRRSETELDWNQPLDFQGALFRKEQIDKLLNKVDPDKLIIGQQGFAAAGNQAIRMNMLAKNFPYSLCMNMPTVSVINLNSDQVTMIEKAPSESLKLNLDFYKLNQFKSVNISELVLQTQSQLNGQLEELSKPKVALVMTVFNQRPFCFREAVESLLRQSYQNWLLIIIDDCSTEPKLLELYEKYSQQEPQRICVIYNNQNEGLVSCLNKGIQQASDIPDVKYIARADSDDISLKDRLLTQVNFMEINPGVDILGTNMIVLRQNLDPKVVSKPTLDQLIKFNMIFYCSIGASTLMFKKKCSEVLHYEAEQDLIEDYDVLLRLTAQNAVNFANLGQSLVAVRKPLENCSTSVPIEAEIGLKQKFLCEVIAQRNPVLLSCLTHDEDGELLTEEFIRVTGRPVRSDTFWDLKHRLEIDQIFNCLIQMYAKKSLKSMKQETAEEQIFTDFILRSLENRKHELSIHAVNHSVPNGGNQNEDNSAQRQQMLTSAQAGQGMSQLKRMLIGGTTPTPKKTTRN